MPRKSSLETVPKGESGGLAQKLRVRRKKCSEMKHKGKGSGEKCEEGSFSEVEGRGIISPASIYLIDPNERIFV